MFVSPAALAATDLDESAAIVGDPDGQSPVAVAQSERDARGSRRVLGHVLKRFQAGEVHRLLGVIAAAGSGADEVDRDGRQRRLRAERFNHATRGEQRWTNAARDLADPAERRLSAYAQHLQTGGELRCRVAILLGE